MNNNLLYKWLPAVIIIFCAALITQRFLDTPDNKQPADADIDFPAVNPETSSKAWGGYEGDDLPRNFSEEKADPVKSKSDAGQASARARESWNKQEWDSLGETLTDKLTNYANNHPKTESLDKKVKPLYATNRELDINKLQEQMKEIRQQGFAGESGGVWAMLQFEPEMNGEDVSGLRLTDAEASDFLVKNGLAHGDVIKQVNGNKLDSDQAAFEGMNIIGESKHLELVVDRSGEIISVVIDKP